jgi:integrase/recombinase XerD
MELAIKSFLEYLGKEKKYTQNTLLSYNGDLTQFRSYVNTIRPDLNTNSAGSYIEDGILSNYFENLHDKGYSVSTLARKVASVKSFIKYLIETGKLSKEKAPELSSPQVNKPVPKPLSVSEVRSFLAEPAKFNTVEAKRDKAMLELLYATGLRASELMSLNVNDLDFDCNSVTCKKEGNKPRTINIDNYITNIMLDYVKDARVKLLNNPVETALFLNKRGERLTRQGFWQIIQGYADRAGLETKVTPRNIRHSFAVHKLNGGADLKTMQELLGHAHISTTKVYQDAQTQFRPGI